MKPIEAHQRRVANIRDASAFEAFDDEIEPGTSMLKLNTELPRDVGFYIYKMDPGSSSTPHQHGGAEEFLMLEGELIDNDGTVYRQGDVVWLAPGTEHSSRTETGCLIAVFAEGEESAPQG
ncbi:cupin domain-containing protein [Roseovarius phycicola]|uniref:Cupin domain-containing protein n=1 Tax=Roseovarius phycicola TaxID=3080976 RepID=A0ABZ2HD42_9RHOB